MAALRARPSWPERGWRRRRESFSDLPGREAWAAALRRSPLGGEVVTSLPCSLVGYQDGS